MLTKTYADVLRPFEKKAALFYDGVLIFTGSLAIAVCAQISIGWPVPVTGQTFAVLMTGALLGWRRGSLSVITYILEGIAGLPVFAMGRSGLPILFGPTGGYLVGFVFAALITGFFAERLWDRKITTTLLAMLLANIAIYISGLVGLGCLLGFNETILTAGLYPFIVGDCLKIILAALLLPAGWKLLARMNPL